MEQAAFRLFAEGYGVQHASHIDVLNIRAGGKMFDIRRAVYHRMNIQRRLRHALEYRGVRHVSLHRIQTRPEQFFIGIFKIIEKQ